MFNISRIRYMQVYGWKATAKLEYFLIGSLIKDPTVAKCFVDDDKLVLKRSND